MRRNTYISNSFYSTRAVTWSTTPNLGGDSFPRPSAGQQETVAPPEQQFEGTIDDVSVTELGVEQMADRILYEGGIDFARRQLNLAGIPYTEETVHIPRRVDGLAFPIEYQPAAFIALEVGPSARLVATNSTRIMLLVSAHEFPVTLASKNHVEQWETMRPIIEEFASLIRRPVSVASNSGTSGIRFEEPGYFHLRFWGSMASAISHSYDELMFGEQLGGGQHDGLSFTITGIPLLSPEGTLVGELFPDALFIPFDLPHPSTPAGSILRGILDLACVHMIESSEYIERRAKLGDMIAMAQRKQFVELCNKRAREEFENATERLKRSEENVTNYSQSLTAAIRESNEYRRIIELGGPRADLQKERFEREYDALRNLEFIHDVNYNNNTLILTTEYLVTDKLWDGSVRELGIYKIRIPTRGGSIKVENLTRKVESRHHPHDVNDGELCLGNMAEASVKLIAQYEYVTLAEMLVIFLQRPNEDDSVGRHVRLWPVLKEHT